MTKRTHTSKSVIRHKRMKANQHLKEVSNRRSQRKLFKQVENVRQQYNRMNGSVFSDNQTFKRLKPQVEKILKIKNPSYQQRRYMQAVVRDFNSHNTSNFSRSRKIFRSTVKTVYNIENNKHGNKWKPLLNKGIPTPQSVNAAKTFWNAYHKLNDLLESKHGSKDIYDSDTKLSYLTGHVTATYSTGDMAGTSIDIAQDTFYDLLQYADPTTGIIL